MTVAAFSIGRHNYQKIKGCCSMEALMIQNKSRTISFKTVGMFFSFIYIFMCYNAVDVLYIPSFVNSLALYAFLAFGLFYLVVVKRLNVTLTQYSIWYLIFMVLSFVTMLYSPEFSILSGQFYLIIVSFCLTFIYQMYVTDEKSFLTFGWFLAISAAFLILTLFVSGKLSSMLSERLGESITGNANSFASMIMVVVFYEFWMMIYGYKTLKMKILLAILILINMCAISLSGGRSAFIVPFVFLYALLIYKSDKKGRKHLIKNTIIMGLIAVAAYFAIMKIPVLYNGVGHRMETYINSLLGKTQADLSARLRDEMRELALKRWLNSPVIGYGFNSFKYYAEEAVGRFYYSHCNYTELLYNGGLFYFIAYYWIYYKIFMTVFVKKKGQMKYRAFAFASLLALIVYDYSIVSYSISFTQMILALSLASLDFGTNEDNSAQGALQNE